MHLDDIFGEKYALYFHNLISENVDDLPFISFYEKIVGMQRFVPSLWWLLWTLLSRDHGSSGRCGHPSYSYYSCISALE